MPYTAIYRPKFLKFDAAERIAVAEKQPNSRRQVARTESPCRFAIYIVTPGGTGLTQKTLRPAFPDWNAGGPVFRLAWQGG